MISLLKKLSDDNPLSYHDSDIGFTDEDLKNEISMLLSSRPMYLDIEELPLVCDSVINYGINSSLLNITTPEEQNIEIIKRITIALKRFEPRISDVRIEHKITDDIRSVFTVKSYISDRALTFDVYWTKSTDNLSLHE
ncbi:GPW/gp25 family protein [Yersinia enterocolitica]|uniref:GPW/gp25 family protein n=1 Tax=Yersinia enterocolitica TaxID=630 RepID=UPI001C6093FB|nr:GPW/gp25 family protein [Yersinia enterocolitica]MBW5823001.1 GPW/gp25 family protein [Yersinia enterocolitica]MBW5852873.1 GPW/gp25 family protein [Yersinia enterocolitica]MBW5870247.1 GPW/gp25 family protein [Yersinia enterocolitica]MBW5879041.1 GPW/gp25 family protein [Yersinia enterocolitica]MBX9477229.1 GPW/gp25 family protein [Yersinia enterocolitica]